MGEPVRTPEKLRRLWDTEARMLLELAGSALRRGHPLLAADLQSEGLKLQMLARRGL